MNSKTKKLDELFLEWEDSNQLYKGKYIRDGIIDENKHERQGNTKVLVIAKEPNDPEQGSWDFREWWNKEDLSYSFSYRIAEWAFGIQHDFPLYSSIWTGKNNGLNAIQKIAFMNIKKTGGKGASRLSELLDYLDEGRNLEYNRQEIDIIQPSIIILCLSWRELRNKLFPELTDKWKDCGYDVPVAKWNNCKILDFYHPSSRNAPAAAYSLLQNVLRSQVFQTL